MHSQERVCVCIYIGKILFYIETITLYIENLDKFYIQLCVFMCTYYVLYLMCSMYI